MVNETVVSYLKNYGDKYDLDDLKKEIVSKGYSEAEFNEALDFFRKEGGDKKMGLKPSSSNPLPAQKFVGKKKGFGWLKFLLILFGILLLGFGLVVLLNFMEMSFFGWNIFDYFA